eukprot:11211839-Lingulodinium_polyedra.AAC.1
MHFRYSCPICDVMPLESCDVRRLSAKQGLTAPSSTASGVFHVAARSGVGAREVPGASSSFPAA